MKAFVITRLNSEDFSNFFLCLDIIIWPYYYERTPREIQKNVEFFEFSWIFLIFFGFFEVFSLNVFCPVSCSHVLYIIRFSMKFCVGEILSSRCATLCKIVMYHKPSKNVILRGFKLRRFTRNQINLHWKASQNHRTDIISNEAFFREKSPTHISATYAITKFFIISRNGIPGQKLYIMSCSVNHWFTITIWVSKNFNRKEFGSSVQPLSVVEPHKTATLHMLNHIQ